MGLKLSSQSSSRNLSNVASSSDDENYVYYEDDTNSMGNVVNFGSSPGGQQSSQNQQSHRHSVVGTADGLRLGGPSTSGSRMRARSLGAFSGSQGIGIPSHLLGRGTSGSPDSDSSSPEDNVFSSRFMQAHSLPVHLLSALHGIKCPVCSKFVPPDDIECHLVICLTKPRISYNEDVLKEDKGTECVICLEDLVQGDTIARLPCLCIYHKSCIDCWFERNRSCPEHPS